MQNVYYFRNLPEARRHNERGFELAEAGLELKDENEQKILRHFWSLRTDLLQILEHEGNVDEGIARVSEWRAEITPEMSERMGGGSLGSRNRDVNVAPTRSYRDFQSP
jgi:serine/threonine-protein kinase